MAEVKKRDGSLAEVIEIILDKGIVIDVWAKVYLVGIELIKIEARIVIASVATWLDYAKAIGIVSENNTSAGIDAAL
ncbi:gas vesicle protein GvpJ [Bacillus sp. USDA818B3_A]|uniref:gas vesicle protein GvpJ n=1 Tax=Bacillus sp. USDA818B3_A TaxID=2698834 RepID=UPI00136A0FD3|nr:gas vesicle protein GvpJ [Bacillus sp. USDA818B3_A]